jgi:hypothetical protein
MEDPSLVILLLLMGGLAPEANSSETILGMCPNLNNVYAQESTKKCSARKCESPIKISSMQTFKNMKYVREDGIFNPKDLKDPSLIIAYNAKGTRVKCVYENEGKRFSLVSKDKYSHCEEGAGDKGSFECKT